MAATDTESTTVTRVPEAGRTPLLESTWATAGFALTLLLILGWGFLQDPALTAPTRDPAWYTWRAQVIMDADPGSVAGEWGPLVGESQTSLLSGGYRITTPLSGALLQRVAGVDTYTFSAFLMLGIPILTGLAFGAAAYRSRRHWLFVPVTLLAAGGMFLTTPYLGYLDNITVLFLLALTFPFLQAARTSWGARAALFLIGMAAAFTHPTTCVLFGLSLMAVFGFHLLTARFRISHALKSDGPTLMSLGFGMIAGLACWVIGIWGVTGDLSDAALPPPYTKIFFAGRLWEWVLSLQPWMLVPMVVAAIGSTILLARRERRPANLSDVATAWWMFPFLGVATVITGTDFQIAGEAGSPVVPYYRFMNASAAPIALLGFGAVVTLLYLARRADSPKKMSLAGLALTAWSGGWWLFITSSYAEPTEGYQKAANTTIWIAAAFALLGLVIAVRPYWRGELARRVTTSVGAVLVIGPLAGFLGYGLRDTSWVGQETQVANQGLRTSLAAVHEIVADAGERPNVLIVNYNDGDASDTRTNTAYGWAKTYTNVFRTGLPGDRVDHSVTYLGTVQNFVAGEQTLSSSGSAGYDRASSEHFNEYQRRLEEFPAEPVVFLIGQYYDGLCNGGTCPSNDPETDQNETDDARAANFERALADGGALEVGPDVYVLTAEGLWTPPDDVIARSQEAGNAMEAHLADHPAWYENPLHNLRVVAGLAVLVILPGFFARRFFEVDDSGVARAALIPGLSIVLTLLTAIAVLAVWRGPLTTTKGYVIAGLAVGLGAVLGLARSRIVKPLDSFAGFFNKLFSQFSNFDFSVLMGMQFFTQAGQGVVQGAIAKSLAFGGEQGFDVQNLPSADYLLKVVLLLYVPYTLISPFIGVFIDRFPRRRVVWWASAVTAVIVAGVALAVLAPLGDGTTEGNDGATLGLILGLLAVQACVRVVLAVKSAAIPDVLSGKDLLQGNSVSQAGGGFFQLVGIAIGGVAAGIVPPFIAVLVGAVIVVLAGIVAKRLRHAEATAHEASFGREIARVFGSIGAGIREVARRAPAALGLTSFQMLRYQFWGFNAFVFGLYAKNLAQGDEADSLSLVLSGVGGLFGAALGIVVAQKLKDRVPPARLLIVAMATIGVGTIVGGVLLSVPGFALMLFLGFFGFFLGKVSADTITQQAMPDDFRGRAFALFDIAYNLGFIIPAVILYFVWQENDDATTRAILLVSGAVFLVLTALMASWARKIRDQLAPQDDLTGEQLAEV